MLHRLKAEASSDDSSRLLRLKPLLYPLKRAKGEGAAPFPRSPLAGCPLTGTPPPRCETRRHCHGTAAAEIPSSPDMAAPKPLPQVRKFGEETIGAFAFHPLDQATDGDVWRDRHHDMDMVRRDMVLENVHSGLLTFLTDDGTDPFGHVAPQHFVAILGDPDAVQVD